MPLFATLLTRLKLWQLLFMGFGLLAILSGGVSGFSQYTLDRTDSAYQNLMAHEITMERLSARLLDLGLQLRRSEKDFFLRRSRKQLTFFQTIFDEFTQKFAELATLEKEHGDESGQQLLRQINEAAVVYRDTFMAMAELEKQKGLDNTSGLRNSLLDVAGQLESLGEEMAPAVANNLHQVFIAEKNYLLNKDGKEVAQFKTRLQTLRSRENPLPVANQEKMAGALAQYEKSFLELVEYDAKIEKISSQMLQGAMAVDRKLGEYHDRSKDRAYRNSQTITEQTKSQIHLSLMASLGVFVLFVVVAMVMARIILRIVGGEPAVILEAIERIASGNLNLVLAGRGIAGHVGRLAATLADMVRQVNLQAHTTSAAVAEQGICAHAMDDKANQTERHAKEVLEETGRLDHATTSMEEDIRGIAREVRGVAAASQQLADNVHTVSLAAEMANDHVAAMAAAAEEMTTNIADVHRGVEQVNRSVATVSSAAEMMTSTLNQVRLRCNEATQQADAADLRSRQAGEVIQNLTDTAHEIGKIVNVINAIAEQTNMLALNASIEAASAGGAGRGFAVVADEVKSLARQTALATDQIADQIYTIQQQVSQAVAATGGVSQAIGQVSLLNREILVAVNEQSHAIVEIAQSIGLVGEASEQVSRNAQEMDLAALEVSRGAQEAATKTRESASAAADGATAASQVATGAVHAGEQVRKIASSAEIISSGSSNVRNTLKELSHNIGQLTSGVRVSVNLGGVVDKSANDLITALSGLDAGTPLFDVQAIKQEDLGWLRRLDQMAHGSATIQAHDLKNHQECLLGRWYEAMKPTPLGELPCFRVIEPIHAEMHALTFRIVAKAKDLDHGTATERPRFDVLRRALFMLLDDLYLSKTHLCEKRQNVLEDILKEGGYNPEKFLLMRAAA